MLCCTGRLRSRHTERYCVQQHCCPEQHLSAAVLWQASLHLLPAWKDSVSLWATPERFHGLSNQQHNPRHTQARVAQQRPALSSELVAFFLLITENVSLCKSAPPHDIIHRQARRTVTNNEDRSNRWEEVRKQKKGKIQCKYTIPKLTAPSICIGDLSSFIKCMYFNLLP